MSKLILLIISATWCFSVNAQTEPIKLSIFFGGGSYYIDYEQVLEMGNAIDSIADINKYQITIYSHTDNIGGKRYNEWLSMMRSQAVLRELAAKEISEELVIVKDFGQDDPLYTNSNYSGRNGNRRVDLILWPVIL